MAIQALFFSTREIFSKSFARMRVLGNLIISVPYHTYALRVLCLIDLNYVAIFTEPNNTFNI